MFMKNNDVIKADLSEKKGNLLDELRGEESPLKFAENKVEKTEELLIPRLKFNPDGGFSMSADMLARLNLAKPAETIYISNSSDIPAAIDISTTSEYTRDEKSSLVKSFTIREEGMFLGIIICVTNKAGVIGIMKEFSTIKFDPKLVGSSLFYDDISVNFYFDNTDIVNELEFVVGFRGNTTKGLRIGDTIEKAIEIYGPPRMKTSIGAIWDTMKVFSDNFSITGIKIRR